MVRMIMDVAVQQLMTDANARGLPRKFVLCEASASLDTHFEMLARVYKTKAIHRKLSGKSEGKGTYTLDRYGNNG